MNHWNKGKLSGYPPCCNVHFHIRFFFIKILGLDLFRWLMKFHNDCGYIQCVFHNLLFRFGLYKIKKYKCAECGWMQIKGDSCMIKHLHTTWVVEEITAQYKIQIKEYGRICMRQPGKIAKKIEEELTK